MLAIPSSSWVFAWHHAAYCSCTERLDNYFCIVMVIWALYTKVKEKAWKEQRKQKFWRDEPMDKSSYRSCRGSTWRQMPIIPAPGGSHVSGLYRYLQSHLCTHTDIHKYTVKSNKIKFFKNKIMIKITPTFMLNEGRIQMEYMCWIICHITF